MPLIAGAAVALKLDGLVLPTSPELVSGAQLLNIAVRFHMQIDSAADKAAQEATTKFGANVGDAVRLDLVLHDLIFTNTFHHQWQIMFRD